MMLILSSKYTLALFCSTRDERFPTSRDLKSWFSNGYLDDGVPSEKARCCFRCTECPLKLANMLVHSVEFKVKHKGNTLGR